MPDSFDSFCRLWPGADPGVEDEEYASSHQSFSNMFLMYTIVAVAAPVDRLI